MTIPNCTNCKYSLDERGKQFDHASNRAFCSKKLDPETKQPVPAEGERFAAPSDGVCGTTGQYWEAR